MMGNKLYVGNLYLRVSKRQLEQLFSHYGNVKNVELIEGSGYGYVEMSASDEAERARKALDGAEFLERVLRVR
jgi:RNA recognition motif-containing protein